MNEFDVIVVGGGPAGAAAATFCAQRGRRVVLFEHARFPRHKVCGDVINPNCWPVLERLGVAGKVRALPQQRLSGAWFTTPSGTQISVPADGDILVAIRRSVFDACLLDHARACGVQVVEEQTVHAISPEGHVITKHGRYIPVEGIVGADGRHSVIAQKSGLSRLGSGARDGYVAFQSQFRAPSGMDDRVHLHLFPGGYCGVVRVDGGCVNLCLVARHQAARWRRDPEELFARTVWRNPYFRELGIAPEPLEPFRSAHPLSRRTNRPCGQGVWLIGDALRVVEPFTGQGILFALRTAELAAKAIGEGHDYARAVRTLYGQRGRTNQLACRFMYHSRAAATAAAVLECWPGARRWLAANVLAA